MINDKTDKVIGLMILGETYQHSPINCDKHKVCNDCGVRLFDQPFGVCQGKLPAFSTSPFDAGYALDKFLRTHKDIVLSLNYSTDGWLITYLHNNKEVRKIKATTFPQVVCKAMMAIAGIRKEDFNEF
jgi:hypothetical protein